MGFEPGCLATAVGSMPHADGDEACQLVRRYLSQVPAWPQLPQRSYLENMYVQFSAGFPGVVVEDEHVYVKKGSGLDRSLEELYLAYLQNSVDVYAVSSDHAAGLSAFLATTDGEYLAVKGQLTGPVSWGLTVTDESRRPLLYDDILADAVAKHLHLKAAWQERALRDLCANTILFVDEPYMSAFGSGFVPLSKDQVVCLLEEVFQGISGLKGVHCCGNTDWSVLLGTSLDILNFDAYNYAESLALYSGEVGEFLRRGGVIAWGIVPNEGVPISQESGESLSARLEEAMGLLVGKGISFDDLVNHCLITPSCGLAGVSVETSARALELTAEVSLRMRRKYLGESA